MTALAYPKSGRAEGDCSKSVLYYVERAMSRPKALKVALIALAALVVLGAIVALIAAKPLARRLAVERAREHGVELECSDLTLGLGHVTLGGCKFHLVGLPSISGTLAQLEVTLSGLSPAGIRVKDVDVQAVGSAPTLALGVVEWTKRYPHTYRLPAEATGARLLWRQSAAKPAWLELRDGKVQRSGTATTFAAEHALVGDCGKTGKERPCADLGKVGAAWSADDAVVMLGFGEQDVARSPIRIEVRHALPRPTADITLAPVKLERLADPFGVALPIKGVTASATIRLEMPQGHTAGVVTGTLSARLEGYVPPHPRELDGFVFGNVTTVDSQLRVTEERERLDLTETKVTAGAFKLAGSGHLTREDDHGRIALELRGSLPCDALADAAAGSYLGKALGGIAGSLAKRFIGGSVGVTVKIDATTADLPNAKIQRIIGVGCGLKPLKLGDIDLSKIQLPPLPSGLPPLPSGLPPLPTGFPPPPKIEIETPGPSPEQPAGP